MKWILFTDQERVEAADASKGTEFKVAPRRVDNPEAEAFGMFAAPHDVIEGEYREFWSERLAGLPEIEADPRDLFLPPDF